jgi:hypothetical protein
MDAAPPSCLEVLPQRALRNSSVLPPSERNDRVRNTHHGAPVRTTHLGLPRLRVCVSLELHESGLPFAATICLLEFSELVFSGGVWSLEGHRRSCPPSQVRMVSSSMAFVRVSSVAQVTCASPASRIR